MRSSIVFLILTLTSVAANAQWRDIGQGKPNDLHSGYTPAVFGVHDSTLFMSCPQPGGGLFRYVPPRGWLHADTGIDFTQGDIYSFASLGEYFFVTTAGNLGSTGNFRSSNNGASWQGFWGGGLGTNGTYLFVVLFNQNGSHLGRSRDSGRTWDSVANFNAGGFASLGRYVFASTILNTLCRSSDSGASWTQISSTLTGMMTVMDSLLYITKRTISKSTDLGSTWRQIVIPRRTVNALAVKSPYLFAGTDSGVFISIDYGADWRNVSDGMMTVGPQYYPDCTALCVFDTMLFVDINAGPATGYIVARPISEMVPKSGVGRVASVPSLDSLEIYPNPASGLVMIRFGSTEITEVSVMNLLGAEVLHAPSPRASELTLDLSRFASGTYILNIETAKGSIVRKVVINR